MVKAKNKTIENSGSVEKFLNSISDPQQKADSFELLKIMQQASGEKPKMWGTAIVGFGHLTIVSAAGREVEWFYVGFSPRKGNLSLYGVKSHTGFMHDDKLLAKLGKFTTGMGCIYVKKLSDIDKDILKKLITIAVKARKKKK